MTETTWLIVITLWVVCAVGAYLIAGQKGDPSPGAWAVAGLLLGPVGLVMSATMAKRGVAGPARDTRTARLVIVLLIGGTVIVALGIVAWAVLTR